MPPPNREGDTTPENLSSPMLKRKGQINTLATKLSKSKTPGNSKPDEGNSILISTCVNQG